MKTRKFYIGLLTVTLIALVILFIGAHKQQEAMKELVPNLRELEKIARKESNPFIFGGMGLVIICYAILTWDRIKEYLEAKKTTK